MKILVKRNEQQPEVTIDLKDVNYAYAIKQAFKLALEIDGFSKSTILEVFNENEDAKVECEED